MSDPTTNPICPEADEAPRPSESVLAVLMFWAKALLIAILAAAAFCMATPGDPFFYQAF